MVLDIAWLGVILAEAPPFHCRTLTFPQSFTRRHLLLSTGAAGRRFSECVSKAQPEWRVSRRRFSECVSKAQLRWRVSIKYYLFFFGQDYVRPYFPERPGVPAKGKRGFVRFRREFIPRASKARPDGDFQRASLTPSPFMRRGWIVVTGCESCPREDMQSAQAPKARVLFVDNYFTRSCAQYHQRAVGAGAQRSRFDCRSDCTVRIFA